MAIKIKSLQNIANSVKKTNEHIYSDLALDITPKQIITTGWTTTITAANDINASYNYSAISNSLTNLLNTLPGQRFLFPDYGLDLRQFLFAPITESTARIIGERILYVINKYEPRIKITNINVSPKPDNSLYNITIVMSIPTLNTTETVDYALNIKNQNFVLITSP